MHGCRLDSLHEGHETCLVCCCLGCQALLFRMSGSCAKCRQSPPLAGDSWCSGCGAWEVLGKELASRWTGAPGLKVIANDLVLSATREVRALRALGAGLGRAPDLPAAPASGARRAEASEKSAGGSAGLDSPRRRLFACSLRLLLHVRVQGAH